MDEPKRAGAAWQQACLAYLKGACADSPCLECGPVHQALRVASVALARWPRPLPRPPHQAR